MGFERAKAAVSGTRFADLRWVATTGSTNADARRELAARVDGPHAPFVLLADHQHAGRGRLDRSWEAPPGSSILMTVALPAQDVPLQRRPLATFALALAATDAAPELELKWPNDLVVPVEGEEGPLWYRKVGGILAEACTAPDGVPWLLLGVGINVNWPELPEDLADTATSLNLVRGHDVDREDLVVGLLAALAQRLPLLSVTDARDDLLELYRRRCITIGSRVRVELGGRRGAIEGTASGVRDDGALLVSEDSGVSHGVTAGDVVHVRPG